MNEEGTNAAADILSNPQVGGAMSLEKDPFVHMDSRKCPNNRVIIESFVFTGYKNVTRKEVGDVVISKEDLWQVSRLLDMCSYHI